MAYIRLVRWQNLIFVALTQYLFYFFVLKPFLKLYQLEPTLNFFYFFLLVLSTCLVTAAGYVINDYFDVKSDVLNKPDRVFIHNKIPRRDAIKLHFTLNIIATLIGLYLAWNNHQWKLAIINPGVAGVLWFYSTHLKKIALLGNIVIGLLTAMVLWVISLYDSTLSRPYTELQLAISPTINQILIAYMLFAFLITIIREIVKDIEDIEGDKSTGARTLPIIIGSRESSYIAVFLILLVVFLLGYIQYQQALHFSSTFYAPLLYTLFFITLPLIYIIIRLVTAIQKSDYSAISNLIKAVMLFGIFSMAVLYFQKFFYY